MNDRITLYEKQIATYEKQRTEATSIGKRLMWLRLFTFTLAVTSLFALWTFSSPVAIATSLLFLLLFGFTAIRDIRNQRLINHYGRLIAICQNEIACINGNTTAFDAGSSYFDVKHRYTYDLDIFGSSSLYQLLCRASTSKGKNRLAQRLISPLKIEDITLHQQAIAELSNETEWRQLLMAVAAEATSQNDSLSGIKKWITKPNNVLSSALLRAIVLVYPIAAISLLALWATGIFSGIVTFALLPYFVIYSIYGKQIMTMQSLVGKSADELSTYSRLLKIIEDKSFTSTLLINLKNKIAKAEKQPSAITAEFAKLVQQLDSRNNIAFMMLVGFYIFWDFRVAFKLNRWRKNYGHLIDEWINVVAEIEMLSSFATLMYNNPDWVMPKIAQDYFELDTINIGHPLIPTKQRVCNSITIADGKTILLTGSNMAGKSTFLRTLGVNMVLAYTGAPVCAQKLIVSYVPIRTSMRITDSLVENTSSFYAEIKRLGEIVAVIKNGEKPFLLLDEILRGTNSNDRHTGSIALINLLVEAKICGIIATHDLALSESQQAYSAKVSNYHFDVQVNENDELYFDYKVKQGICTSLNASILMRKIGLKM